MPRRARAVAVDASPVNQMQAAVRPVGEPSDADLELINRQALKPQSRGDVYVFRMEISNDLTDSYWTRMDPRTTLPNYVADFRAGRSIQNSHRTTELPLGRSYWAELEQRGTTGDPGDPARTAAVLSAYIPRGVNLNGVATDDLIRGIDAGVVKDGSVHFDPDARYVCDLCGGDMYERQSSCIHLPGMQYEGQRATATIVGAHAIEGSLVFDGSTPKAMVDKAQRMSAAGHLSSRELAAVEQLYRCRLNVSGPVVGAPITAAETAPELPVTPGPPLGEPLDEPLNDGGAQSVQCPNCGTWVPEDAGICPECGTAIRANTTGEPGEDVNEEDQRAMTTRAAHAPFTGTHTHPHPAFGSQGGDELHEHQHTHDGDAVHDHDHSGTASADGGRAGDNDLDNLPGTPAGDNDGDADDRSRYLDLVPVHVRDSILFWGVDVYEAWAGRVHSGWAKASARKRATWSTAMVNDLPDSAFAYIAPGGAKEDGKEDGKTSPRSLRYFPHHGPDGSPDAAHVRNALARIPQADVPDAAKSSALAHVRAHAKTLGIETEESKKSRSQGGAMLDPVLFADLCGSRLTRARLDHTIDALVAGDPDGVTPDFVRRVAAEIATREGPAMNSDMASQMQGILDQMADAHDAHTEALDDLKTLVGLGSEGGMQYGLPDQGVGLPDMDPDIFSSSVTASYGPGATPNGTGNGTQPPNGTIGRGRAIQMGQPGQSLADKVKGGLAGIQHIIEDLLADDANESAQSVEDQGAEGMGITEAAIGPGPATGDDQEPYPDAGRGRGEDPERRALRILEMRKALRLPEMEPLRRVLRQAGDGRRYRSLTCRELLEWGVRAQGDKFPLALYRRLLPAMETSDAEELVRQFRAEAYRRFQNAEPGEVPEWFGDSPLAARVGRASAPAPERHEPPPGTPARRSAPAAPAVDVSRFRAETVQ